MKPDGADPFKSLAIFLFGNIGANCGIKTVLNFVMPWFTNFKAVLYRDAVSVETGSSRYFCSVTESKTQFLGIEGIKDTFSQSKDTLNVSKSLDTVSVSVSATQFFCIGNSLGHNMKKVAKLFYMKLRS